MGKKIMVTQSSMPPFDQYVEKIKSIWDKRWLTNNGPLHQELEEKLKQYLKCENLQLFVNGHMALDLAVKALCLKGEVITTPFTFASTTHALVMNGLTPVFCDIKSTDFTIDEKQIEGLVTDKTSAILAVHVYGQPCNVEQLDKISKKHNLKIIYDAAHAFGVEVNEQSIANYGDVSMFSFHATKVFNTIEGGALAFKDQNLTRSLQNLRNFGIEGPESVVDVGLNAKMSEFSAAMGLCNLESLEENLLKRKHITQLYNENLKNCYGIKTLNFLEDKGHRQKHNYAYYPIVVDEQHVGYNRDELYEELAQHNIFTRKYFYPLVTEYACYQEKFSQNETPVAKRIAERVLCLPLYADLDTEEVIKICKIICDFKDR